VISILAEHYHLLDACYSNS